mmetsp:Transcript_35170/g.35813  ORF Transcript_35170/g.35813 Transcript_35170/m.35813 type:complete len:307 (+) Transcript_35170:35-955(+)
MIHNILGAVAIICIILMVINRMSDLKDLFLYSTFGAGFLNGGLHALSAPDHIAALIPFSIGKRWWQGMYFGASWSIGHGISAFIIGYIGYQITHISSISSTSLIDFLTRMSGFAVGITLTVIGLMGVYETSLESTHESIKDEMPDFTPSGKIDPSTKKSLSAPALFLNGLLLGFSWDLLPSLAPAVSMSTVDALMLYLTAYVIGTVLCVALAAAIVGECTMFLVGSVPDLPVKLALIASTISVLIGSIWLATATHEQLQVSMTEETAESSWSQSNATLLTALAGAAPLALLGVMTSRIPVRKMRID